MWILRKGKFMKVSDYYLYLHFNIRLCFHLILPIRVWLFDQNNFLSQNTIAESLETLKIALCINRSFMRKLWRMIDTCCGALAVATIERVVYAYRYVRFDVAWRSSCARNHVPFHVRHVVSSHPIMNVFVLSLVDWATTIRHLLFLPLEKYPHSVKIYSKNTLWGRNFPIHI